MNRISKLITLFLVFLLYLTNEAHASFVFQNKIYGDPIYLGEPLNTRIICNTAFGKEDGHNTLYTTLNGSPAQFYVIDVDTGSTLRKFELAEGVKSCWTHKIDSNNNVYFVPHGVVKLYQYSPLTKQVTECFTVQNETAAYGLCFDENNNIYFGTYPSAKIIKYNTVSGEITDFGTIFEGERYVMSMVYHNGYLYAGGQSDNAKFVKINVNSKTITTLDNPNSPDLPTGFLPTSFYMMSIVDDLIFTQIRDLSNSYTMCVYNITTGKWVKSMQRSFGHYVSPKYGDTNKVYMLGGLPNNINTNAFYSFDLTTYEIQDSGIRYYGNYIGGGWMDLPGNSNLPGQSLVTIQQGKILAFNPNTKSAVFLDDNIIPPLEIYLQDIESTNDNRLVMGGYMSDKGIIYNPEDGSTEEFAITQTETIKNINGKIYFGCYTGAVVKELDLSIPISSTNPKTLGSFKNPYYQDRVFDIIDAGGTLAVSTYPQVGYLGGTLSLYDFKTRLWETYKNIVPDQSVEGLTYIPETNKVYGTTSIFGGANPTQKEAKIFEFSLNEKKITKTVTPSITGVDRNLTYMGEIKVGADGNLWTVSAGVIFALDPNTLEVVKSKITGPFSYDKKMLPTNTTVRWSSDGMLYTNPNRKLIILNPETLEHKDTGISMNYFCVGNDGNIYYTYANELYKLPVIETKQLQILSQGNGLVTPIGEQTVQVGSTISITVTPDTGYGIEYIKFNNQEVASNLNRAYTYRTPEITTDSTIEVKFLEVDSLPNVTTFQKVFPYMDLSSKKPCGIIFGTVSDKKDFTLVEYGIVFSNTDRTPTIENGGTKYSATVSKNSFGQYGIKLYGDGLKVGTTYYATAYAVYHSEQGGYKTYYGDPVSFTPLAEFY